MPEVDFTYPKRISELNQNRAIHISADTTDIQNIKLYPSVKSYIRPPHQALSPAFHIGAILPKTAPTERLRRTTITEDLGLREALDKYIENNHFTKMKLFLMWCMIV